MATLVTPSLPVAAPPVRDCGNAALVPCAANGKIAQALALGDEHKALGDFENAWTAYSVALDLWVTLQWLAHSNKTSVPKGDPLTLLQKLRSSSLVDRWAFDAILSVLHRPTPVGWFHADVAEGIAKGVCGQLN